jgi:hypothetical protein
MRRWVLFVLVLTVAVCIIFLDGCNRESAVKQLMADPQMSQMVMQTMWETPTVKAKLMEKMMADPETMNKIKEALISDPNQAAMLMDMMLAKEDLKGMITEKTMALHGMKK